MSEVALSRDVERYDGISRSAANLTGFTNAWGWSKVTMGGPDASMDLTTTGEHTLEAYMREDGLRVDRVLLITDTNYIPSGLGPAESLFQTITETIPGGLGTTSIAYQYDALYRLTDATYSGAITASFAYDYDPVGNMTAFTETVDAQTTSVTRTFDGANRLEYAIDASGTTMYTYDANGNLIELLPPGATVANPVGGLRYAYDQRNLMVSHETNPDGTAWVLQAEYVYDGANDRLQQVDYTGATPITTTYTNDVFALTQVLVAGDGTTEVYNLFGLDLISQDSGAEVRTLLVGGLGSVRLEMVGDVVETATTYSPYGEVLEQTGASGTVYGFTGEQEDGATGLLYLRARYYSPELKVFHSRDPWEGTGWRPQTLNLYTFVRNNPANHVDPSGYCTGNPDGVGNTYEENLCWTKIRTIINLWDNWWANRFGSQEALWALAEVEYLDTAYWDDQLLAYGNTSYYAERRLEIRERKWHEDNFGHFTSVTLSFIPGPLLPGGEISAILDDNWNIYVSGGLAISSGVGRAVGIARGTVLFRVDEEGSFTAVSTNQGIQNELVCILPGESQGISAAFVGGYQLSRTLPNEDNVSYIVEQGGIHAVPHITIHVATFTSGPILNIRDVARIFVETE